MNPSAVILSTGDELTTGKVIDTNSAVIAERFYAAGIQVAAVLKVGDDREKLLWAFSQARSMGDLIIGTGGLGPTADDLTSEMVAEFLGIPLIRDDAVADGLKERFTVRGIHLPLNRYDINVLDKRDVILRKNGEPANEDPQKDVTDLYAARLHAFCAVPCMANIAFIADGTKG